MTTTPDTTRAVADGLPRLALSLPNMAEPHRLLDIAVRAENAGWDGLLLWDHVHGSPDFAVPTSDTWTLLGAIATCTSRITIGTGITPVARRQPRDLARQTVTVDHLSNGRLVLGVGLGEPPEEYTAYGESADPRRLGARLDEGLDVIAGLWSGEPFDHHGPHFTVERAQYLPTPVQQPRIPVWAGCTIPHTRPLRRAAKWDGVILAAMGEGTVDPVPVPAVERALAQIAKHRASDAGPFDIAVSHSGIPSDDELKAYADVGVTWVLVANWIDALEAMIDALPRRESLSRG